MPRFAPHFPDALIGQVPVVRGRVEHPDEELQVVVIRFVTPPVPAPRKVENLTVSVKLSLGARRIARPHGA
jgi:hypothetical protein